MMSPLSGLGPHGLILRIICGKKTPPVTILPLSVGDEPQTQWLAWPRRFEMRGTAQSRWGFSALGKAATKARSIARP